MQKKSSKHLHIDPKNHPDLIPYDPIEEIINGDLISRAMMECLRNNDPEGVIEVLNIYLNAIQTIKAPEKSNTRKLLIRSKNPTIKTVAKIMHAAAILHSDKS